MSYAVKEIVYTLQGEGANTGRPAVICRFAGCNLWSGEERDRAQAVCYFCDTDFVGTDGPGGGCFESASELAQAVGSAWRRFSTESVRPFVICTGGEPLLQVNEELVTEFHNEDFEVGVDTNGTLAVPRGVDWLCVSPKSGSELIVRRGDELKLVFPQPGAEPGRFERLDFRYFYLQPMDDAYHERNVQLALRYCLAHPTWRLSLQIHKMLNIP